MIPENFRRCLEVAFADPGELAEKIAFLERSVLEPARANVELESLIAAQNLSNKRYAEAVAVLKALGGLTEPSPVVLRELREAAVRLVALPVATAPGLGASESEGEVRKFKAEAPSIPFSSGEELFEAVEKAVSSLNEFILRRATELGAAGVQVTNRGSAKAQPAGSNELDFLQARCNSLRNDVYPTTIAAQQEAGLARRLG